MAMPSDEIAQANPKPDRLPVALADRCISGDAINVCRNLDPVPASSSVSSVSFHVDGNGSSCGCWCRLRLLFGSEAV
eukprot:CAMPEP_0184694668 /NCGR_PEP_ID=MMETSP0313-20130426/2544_1 /TAXON_ID=2792 /ORGANISM="Porphyridium aerugineum, Strain SAG 1380-2" /LENGTH=76 /DNA_ID=CAMNT_0027152993 /DNA_START=150 /DNA_END=377 /DNA_ORIENTATION=-